MFRLRSVSNIVIAPARTGSERSSKMAVIVTAQTNSEMFSRRSPSQRIFTTVVIKLRAPRIDETPAK